MKHENVLILNGHFQMTLGIQTYVFAPCRDESVILCMLITETLTNGADLLKMKLPRNLMHKPKHC